VLVGFLIGRLEHAFSILRIFTDFRMARLPMILLVRRGSEGAEPLPSEAKCTLPRPRCLRVAGWLRSRRDGSTTAASPQTRGD